MKVKFTANNYVNFGSLNDDLLIKGDRLTEGRLQCTGNRGLTVVVTNNTTCKLRVILSSSLSPRVIWTKATRQNSSN